MRAESRIALVLVTCLLGGLGFFVQDRLKSETTSADEELAQFLDPDVGEGSATDESGTDGDTHAAATPDNDEPPRDLFTNDDYATPRETARTAASTGSAVSPNPWSRSTGTAAVSDASRAASHPLEDESTSSTIAWADSGVTQASGTAPTPAAASSSTNPFAAAGTSSSRTATTGTQRGFTPNDLIAPTQTEEPGRRDSSESSAEGNDQVGIDSDFGQRNESTLTDPFDPADPWETAPTQVTAANNQTPAPSTTQPAAQPVFFQTPAPGAQEQAAPESQTNPFGAPGSASTNTPAAASDPFAPVQTTPAPAQPSAPAQSPPTFNFSNPPTTQTPAQSTPAPALSPTPSNPFGTTTTAASTQQSYSPQGLQSAPGGDPGTKIYEVTAGDNYWTISRKVYGAGRYFSALAEYNKPRIEDPDRLAPGMIVLVPTTEILDQRYSNIISTPPPGEGGTAPAGFFVDAAGQPMYRVGESDTLSAIAQTYLGRSSRWVQIYGMNREVIENADALKPGTVLQLPPDAAPIALGPEESVVR